MVDIMADIEDTNPVDAALRAEVRAWLKANWTGDLPVEQDKWKPSTATCAWTAKVLEAGWAVPTWPREWFGRGLTQEQGDIVDHEFARLGAPGARQDRSNLAANTMLAFGEEALKREMIPGLLKREIVQCLLYSEPAAGSDLAGVRTRAERDGDDYVINGQKVWTSGAVHAHYGMLLARTDWEVPKHNGLTFFFFPMKQPGVEVRPLRQITDESHFNEVFITNARVPAANIMGGLNNGWRVMQTALAYERSMMGDRPRGARHSATSNDLVALARQYGNLDDPALRQDLAGVLAFASSTPSTTRGPRRTSSKARLRPSCRWASSPCRASCTRRPACARRLSAPKACSTARTIPSPRTRTSWPSTPTSPRSAAAPTRSSATSSANGCSACPRKPKSTATCRSGRFAAAEK